MRITFNGQGSGFGDNGGTATIYHSANILSKLGHEVYIVSEKKNYFTWFDIDGPKYIKTQRYDYPDADVLIGTGVSSVKHVLNSPAKKGLKFWWVRAHETWMAKHDNLLGIYRNPNIEVIVNSICLQKFIHRLMGYKPAIIRPGITLTDFYPERKRNWSQKKKMTLGGLYNLKPRKRFKWILESYEQLARVRGLDIDLVLFGTESKPKDIQMKRYFKKPSPKTLRQFYNMVDIWLAPTNSEGLHIPPQEAMLCGCIVIGSNSELGGMADYLEDGKTGYVVPDWPEMVDKVTEIISMKEDDRAILYHISNEGRKKVISLGDREENMGRLLHLFEDRIHRRALQNRSMRHRMRV